MKQKEKIDEVDTKSVLKAKRAYPDMPGNSAGQLLNPAKDQQGQVWPKGTIFSPWSWGADNGRLYQTVIIGGRKRTFYQEAQQ